MAKAAYWTITDAEARKRGEQTGLPLEIAVVISDKPDAFALERAQKADIMLFLAANIRK